MATVTLTKDAVTLYDIEKNSVWDTMSVQDAQRDLQICHDLGDTIQEYETTDLDGNPLRVVLQVSVPSKYSDDQGGVYVIPLLAAN
jgi:hypothetical protein